MVNRRFSVDPRTSRQSEDDIIRFHLDVEVGIVQLTIGSSEGVLTCAQVGSNSRLFRCVLVSLNKGLSVYHTSLISEIRDFWPEFERSRMFLEQKAMP